MMTNNTPRKARDTKRVFLSTTIVCPVCGKMIDKLPSGMQEAISDRDRLICNHCDENIIVRVMGGQHWTREEAPEY